MLHMVICQIQCPIHNFYTLHNMYVCIYIYTVYIPSGADTIWNLQSCSNFAGVLKVHIIFHPFQIYIYIPIESWFVKSHESPTHPLGGNIIHAAAVCASLLCGWSAVAPRSGTR